MEENTKLLSKEYYTVDDLSKYFGVSQDLIIHFVKNGTIKTINKGDRRMLIPKKDFNQGAKEMLEYLLSSPIDKKTMKNKINPVSTFWIFGLGIGLGSWLISGNLFDFIVGIIMGGFIWFVLLILFGGPVMAIYRRTKEKLNKYKLINGDVDVKVKNMQR
jgi:excisionase family DNA binding protein